MYTNTDVSDDEPAIEKGGMDPQHPKSVRKIVELIIRKVELNLRHAATKQCAGGSIPHGRAEAHSSSGQSSRKTSTSVGSKRKSRLGGSPPIEEDDENGPNKRRRGSTTTTDAHQPELEETCIPFLACSGSNGMCERRVKVGDEWETVMRLKCVCNAGNEPVVDVFFCHALLCKRRALVAMILESILSFLLLVVLQSFFCWAVIH